MKKNNNILNQKLYSNIQTIIESSKNAVSRAVNSTLVRAYWEIGRLIFEEEQKGKSRADYGSYIVESLSKQLIKDYGKGSPSILYERMYKFRMVCS